MKRLSFRKQKENKKHDVSEDDAISPAEDSGNDKSISDDDLPF
ncbi:hypothetical protein UM496_00155 (plasmid) [Staphylococcus aureus]|nr:hypothetical protein UM496_00155 [Staphylococcus aureus]